MSAGNQQGIGNAIKYQENMANYRYLVDMAVKYMLMFFGVSAFCLQQSIEEGALTSLVFVRFAAWFGVYSSISLIMVFRRMKNLAQLINEAESADATQNFGPLFVFLCMSCFAVGIPAFLLFGSSFSESAFSSLTGIPAS